ncbi:MAG: matrixin family metalloprotease [Alphaproteobacteria bacterium]
MQPTIFAPAEGGQQYQVQAFVQNAIPNWPAGQAITWSNVQNPADIQNPFSATLSEAFLVDIRASFAAWAAVANLTFQEVADNPDVDIRFGFSESLPGSAIGLATTSFFPTEPIHSDIQFLSSVNFVTVAGVSNGGAGQAIPFISVALHEIGHSLGLGHETVQTAIMNPVVDVNVTSLQQDDINGMVARYGAALTGDTTGGGGDTTGGGSDTTTAGTAAGDTLVGDTNADDAIDGLGGNDVIFGLAGNDMLFGGDGDDSLIGNIGNDTLDGSDGSDTLRGKFDDDTLLGGNDNDSLFGGAGGDSLDGGAGNDTVNGSSGLDTLLGGTGNDVLRGQGSNDTLNGNDGDDLLLGIQGNDVLFGGAGNDTLIGGQANDTSTGGAGVDVFAFNMNHGADTIADFENGTDVISIVGAANFAALTIVASGLDSVITFETVPTTQITVANTSPGQLDDSDFFFST